MPGRFEIEPGPSMGVSRTLQWRPVLACRRFGLHVGRCGAKCWFWRRYRQRMMRTTSCRSHAISFLLTPFRLRLSLRDTSPHKSLYAASSFQPQKGLPFRPRKTAVFYTARGHNYSLKTALFGSQEELWPLPGVPSTWVVGPLEHAFGQQTFQGY